MRLGISVLKVLGRPLRTAQTPPRTLPQAPLRFPLGTKHHQTDDRSIGGLFIAGPLAPTPTRAGTLGSQLCLQGLAQPRTQQALSQCLLRAE